MYRYGRSFVGTMSDTTKWVRMYQSPKLEFAFKQLPQGLAYRVTVAHDGYQSRTFDLETRTDVDLGVLRLSR
jgi:hypothetical protein